MYDTYDPKIANSRHGYQFKAYHSIDIDNIIVQLSAYFTQIVPVKMRPQLS